MGRTMILMLALGLSVITGLLLWSYTEEQKKKLLQRYRTVEVVVAAKDIPAKTVIQPGDVQTELIPVQFVQPGATYQIEDVVGKVTLVPLRKGMQVVSDVVVDVAALSGLSAVLEKGYRAVSVRVDAITGVGGHIQPGDFVDVLVILPSRDPMDAWTVVAFQGVQVMAVGSKMSVPTLEEVMRKGGGSFSAATLTGNASHITVQLPVELARDLVVLSEVGKVIMALRRFGDLTEVMVDTLRVRDIVRKYTPRVKRKYRRVKPREVEVYRGLQKDVYRVKGDRVQLVRSTGGGTGGGIPFHGVVPAAAGTQRPHREVILEQLGSLGLMGGP